MPIIKKEFNPSIVETLYRTGLLLQEDEQVLKRLSFSAKRRCQVQPDKLSEKIKIFDKEKLTKEPSAIRRRVFKMALSELGFNERRLLADHLISADKLLLSENPSGYYNLPYNFCILRCNNFIFFIKEWDDFKARLKEANLKKGILITGPCKIELEGDLGEIYIEELSKLDKANFCVKKSPKALYLDKNKVGFPFIIRNRQAGDRFWPIGFNTSIKLKDFLINRHVPKILRDLLPIVEKDGEIVAICNLEISDHYKVNGDKVIKIYWQPKGFVEILQLAISQ